MNYNFNNGSQFQNNSGDVTLIIIAPRQVYDIAQRPNLFNITNGAFDTIHQSVMTGSMVSKGTINSLISEHQLMFPEVNPTVINTSSMTGCYSFILIKTLHDDGPNNSQFVISKPTKMIAIGHFSEEPIHNHSTFTTSRNYNPRARLDIQSAILLKDMVGMSGGVKNVTERVMDYLDIARNIPSMVKHSDGMQDVYRMDPSTYVTAADEHVNNVGNSITGPQLDEYVTVHGVEIDTSSLNYVDSRHVVSNSLATSTGQVESVLLSAAANLNNDRFQGDSMDNIRNVTDNLSSSNRNPVADIHDLQSDSLYLGELINRYNPKVEIINPGQPTQMNIMDPNLASPSAVASTIVTQAVRPIMVDLGILDIAFAYESYPSGELRVDQMGTISPVSDNVKIEKMKMFKQRMEIEVFRLIQNVFGAFNAVVSVNSSYQTHVDVNLLDFDGWDGVMVTDNVFKCYSSPSFGSKEAFTKNANETNTLIQNIICANDINGGPIINDVGYARF